MDVWEALEAVGRALVGQHTAATSPEVPISAGFPRFQHRPPTLDNQGTQLHFA